MQSIDAPGKVGISPLFFFLVALSEQYNYLVNNLSHNSQAIQLLSFLLLKKKVVCEKGTFHFLAPPTTTIK